MNLFILRHGIAVGFVLKKGGLAKLKAGKLRTGQCATLAWLLAPTQMKLRRQAIYRRK